MWYYNTRHIRNRKCQLNIINYQRGGKAMKFFRKLGFQLVLFFVVAITIPIVMLMVSSITTTSSSMENNMKVTSEQTLNEAQNQFTTYLKTLSQPVDLLTRKNEVKHLEDQGTLSDNVKAVRDSLIASVKVTNGAERAFFATNTNLEITGWGEYNPETGKTLSKGGLENGVDRTKEVWYTDCKGLKARNSIYAYFSKPYYSKDFDKTIITVSQEIKHSDGTNYGTVGMHIDFSEITDFVQGIGLLNTGFVVLADEDGNILVNNDNNKYVTDSVSGLNCWSTVKGLTDADYDKAFSFDENINGEKVHVVTSKDAVTGWTLVGFISSKETSATTNKMISNTVIFSIIAFVIGIGIALAVTASMTKEIKKVSGHMKDVAGGDLTDRIDVKKKNEFGDLENNFNNMVENMAVLIKGVEEKSGVIVDASAKIAGVSKSTTETVGQVSEAIQSVAVGASGQADSTQTATQEVENLADRLKETKAYVTDISDMSVETQKLSNKGLTIVDELITKGQRSIDNSKISKAVVSEMVSSIEKINFISDAITEITEQTNLLSLNASIEAARAGESGKGFAVVADEIRKLAEQSQQSTDEIKQIVNEITIKSQQVEQTMDESVGIIEEQNVSIKDAKELFNTISDSVNGLKEGLDNITQLNEAMDTNRNNVVSKMEDVAAVATETAAASEEVTASAVDVEQTMHDLNEFTVELDNIAEALKEAIDKFKLQ
ncbi:HAMP domain-containing protein [[Eubacterium] eligens]|uniref:HAMP domain-containing protein n=2 Tax=Lachnospira eligens TaxID=39485 RepID=A0A7C9H521_9FIRM|nr:HAMP domain-containing protein [Lachnospira eligens]